MWFSSVVTAATETRVNVTKPTAVASVKAGFHMIADDRGRRSQIAETSAIVCDHMETHISDRLRSCDRDRRR